MSCLNKCLVMDAMNFDVNSDTEARLVQVLSPMSLDVPKYHQLYRWEVQCERSHQFSRASQPLSCFLRPQQPEEPQENKL